MVITNVNQVVYRGDGVTTAFPFTFRIIDATDIKLLLIDADGTETDIQSDYFVDTVNNTVHYPGYAPGAEPPEADQPAPVQTGQKLVIYRELPITQEKNLGDKWPFFVIELGLDKLTLILQQIYGWWGRTLKFGVGWQIDHPDFDTTIPVEAGKTWRVNDEGTGFVATGDPDEAVVVANNAKDVAAGAKATAEGIAATAQEAKDIAQDAKTVADDAKYVAARAKATAEGIAAAAQADWNVTDTTSKAFIKNKPDVLLKSGGTLTGVVNGVTPPNGDNSKKLATTEFVNAKAGNYLPLTGGTMTTGNTLITMGNGESYVRCWGNGLYLGGTYRDNASRLILFTNSNAGGFQLEAGNGTTLKRLWGYPNGTLTWDGQPLLPVGVVQAYAGTTIPNGWLLCDGSAVSRTTYANLYACIGTTYGAGNGSTTFNLPNLVDKFVEGSARAGTVKSAGLPNITGSFHAYSYADGDPTGCMTSSYPSGNAFYLDQLASSSTRYDTFNINASRSSSIYGNSTTVQPPALTMRYIIKY